MNMTPPCRASGLSGIGVEARIARAEAARQADERKRQEEDRRRCHQLQERIDAQQLIRRDGQRLGKSSTGNTAVQNFDQRKSCIEIGDVRMIQNADPSAETAGNTKRTPTVAITKPAIPRLMNA